MKKQLYTVNDYVHVLTKHGLLASTLILKDDTVKFITYNSKEVVPGTLFVCKGAHFKKEYLEEALEKGAIAYMSEEEFALDGNKALCNMLLVNDIRKSMAYIADLYYERIHEKIYTIGITGTKGKSTTTYFMRSILDDYMKSLGKNKTAVLSGIDNYDGVVNEESHLTTPEIMALYGHMENAVNSNMEYLTMEVSSQALKYDRVIGINFDVACFLNIGVDHISGVEHPDFEDYFQSKLRIFEQCKVACVNMDTQRAEEVLEAAGKAGKILTFGKKTEKVNIFGYDVKSDEGRVTFRARSKGLKTICGAEDFDEAFELGIFGTLNVENALAAISICCILGVPLEFIKSGLLKAQVSGRMEVFRGRRKKVNVIVDYAHNQLSFETLFKSMEREFPGRRVTIVFGCPGKKAQGRRKELGEVAGKYSSKVYLTEEDSGEEDVLSICEEIASHVEAEHCPYEIITDRKKAIEKAIGDADDNTVVLLTGKGRETRQKRGIEYIETPSDVDYVLGCLDCEYNK